MPKALGWKVPPPKEMVPVPRAEALPTCRVTPGMRVVPPV
jgi:hypothetical protein